jgi:hypothetical protein
VNHKLLVRQAHLELQVQAEVVLQQELQVQQVQPANPKQPDHLVLLEHQAHQVL